MKKITGIVLGALLVAVGVITALGVFGIADITVSLDGWWTLFLIVPCLNGLLTQKDKTGNFVGLAVGVMLLLAARDVLEYAMIWKLIVPIIIILFGIKMIEQSTVKKNEEEDCADKGVKEAVSAFGSKTIDCMDEELTAAKIAAVFGGVKCNLTDAEIKDGSRIDVMCLFGGADIIVPEDVTVKVNTFCLFGGISDKRAVKNRNENAATLNINGFCLFGGADIK